MTETQKKRAVDICRAGEDTGPYRREILLS